MVKFVRKILADLGSDFWGTLGRWQDQRPIWLLGGGVALGLEIFSWAYFQNYSQMDPCELCVYIRFSMVVIFVGAVFAAIKPANVFFKLVGYAVVIYGMIQGLSWDMTLAADYVKAAENPWSVLCSGAAARYPLGLPLAEWLPGHFAPVADCGQDGWRLWGWNMAQWLYLVYGVYLIGIFCLLTGWIVNLVRRKKGAAAQPGGGAA